MARTTPAVGPRDKWLKRRCKHCGKLFPTSRSDAQLCSAKCRQAEARIRRQAAEAMETLKGQLAAAKPSEGGAA